MCIVTQLCLTLFNPLDCSLPGSSVHGIFQARITGLGFYFPPPRDLLDPGIKPVSAASQADSLSDKPSGKPGNHISAYTFCNLSEPQFPCQEVGDCTLHFDGNLR